jgi:hypothetical protein
MTAAAELETRVCPDCGADRPVESFGGSHPDSCFRCHALSLRVDSKAMPTRGEDAPLMSQATVAKMREHRANANAWERGTKIARRNRDGSEMPYLSPVTGTPVGVKEWADNRSTYEQAAAQVQTDPMSIVSNPEE